MALINNIYIFVQEESIDENVETTSHPTESGLPISDTIRKQPIAFSLNGKIVNTDTMTSNEIVSKVRQLQQTGSLITYVGQIGTIRDLQIQSFNETYTHKNYGGIDFDMTLKQIKTAKSAYVVPKKVVSTPTKKKLKVGDRVSFKGGNVYVSSIAVFPSSKRGASTCEITQTAPGTHPYHLKSIDGRLVFGWVDASTVFAVSSQTANSSNGGTQQVQGQTKGYIYYTVKPGDTLFGIVNTIFRSMNLSITEIMKANGLTLPTQLKAGMRLKL